ncbi:hypothetical protein ACFX2B_037616 [Malus domestica]
MTPGFYQKHWSMVGTDVCNGVRHLLMSGQMLRKINYTHVTLITKLKDATMMTQLCPISLCNVIYKILTKVNGNPMGYVHPKREIHLRDPLSPYLFDICVEGLSALLRKAEFNEERQGIKVCREAPSIHHLFFADDSFLFAHARYFPRSKFMEALVTPNSSYVWRSIAASRQVIHKGHHWQVGNGQRIQIWEDNGIPRDSFFCILTPPLRDWDMEGAVAGHVAGAASALYKELFAARQALWLLKSRYPPDMKINLEEDSSLALAAMAGREEDVSVWGLVINDLRNLLMDLPFVECGHVQREAKSVAHRLARMGLNCLQEVLWFEVPPDLIQDLLFEEGL